MRVHMSAVNDPQLSSLLRTSPPEHAPWRKGAGLCSCPGSQGENDELLAHASHLCDMFIVDYNSDTVSGERSCSGLLFRGRVLHMPDARDYG